MKTTNLLDSKKGWSTLQRPRFSPGLLLEDEDLTASVDYTRSLMQLMLRSLFGCGVVCGLEVGAWLTCHRRKVKITVGGGVALDGLGNPIHLPASQTLVFDPGCEEMPPDIWVAVCHVEKCCRPKDVSCSEEESRTEPTRSVDGFEIKLYREPPTCACSCGKPTAATGKPARRGCCEEGENGTEKPGRETPGKVPDEKKPMVGKVAAQQLSANVVGAAKEEEKEAARQRACECFEAHNAGVCCDCDDRCVLLAKISTTPLTNEDGTPTASTPGEEPVDVVDDVRRNVRPVLTGFLDCLARAPTWTSPDQNPAVGTPDRQVTPDNPKTPSMPRTPAAPSTGRPTG